jgi:hypothetical protein
MNLQWRFTQKNDINSKKIRPGTDFRAKRLLEPMVRSPIKTCFFALFSNKAIL